MNTVLFDLDNTLFDPSQYFLDSFKIIAKYLSKKYNINQTIIFKLLVKIWKEKTSMHPTLFNDLILQLGIKNNENEILVRIFNEFKPNKLNLYQDVIPILQKLKLKKYQLGIITDGNFQRQKQKIVKLDLEKFFKLIVYTDCIKPKPSQMPYVFALEKLGVNASNSVYVGDNPHIDFEGAKKVGITTVRILRGEFHKIPNNKFIDHQINDLRELLEILKI